jgi:alpha-1,2-mannosyltransferase
MSDSGKKIFGLYVLYSVSFIVFAYACFSIYRIVTTSAPDFEVYYGATEQLVRGISPYAGSALYTGFGYPPFTAVVFLLFLVFPPSIAQGIFVVLSAISIPCISWMAYFAFRGKKMKFTELLIFSSVFFLLFPTRFTLGMGQSNLIALLFVCGSIYEWKQGKKTLCSILFGISMCFKPHFLLVLPFLLLAGEWVFVMKSLAVVVGAGIVSVFFFGWGKYIRYYQDMVLTLLPYSGRGIYYNQGFAGFFARIFPQNQASIATACASLVLYISGAIAVVRNRMNLPTVLALGLCVMVLVEPLSWQHHIIFLIPAIIFLRTAILSSKTAVILLVCSLFLIGYNIRQPDYFQNMNLGPILLSHGFFGTVMITGLLFWFLRKQNT